MIKNSSMFSLFGQNSKEGEMGLDGEMF